MKKTYENVKTGSKTDGRSKGAKLLEAYLASEGGAIRSYAYGLCRDAVEAQELVQETCYRALRAWDRYDDTRPLGGWMTTILRNAFMDSRRRVERRKGLSLDVAPWRRGNDFNPDDLVDGSEGVLERLEREESGRKVRNAVSLLKPRHRRVLQLCEVRGLSHGDAARILQVPIGTVRSRLHRARAMLRRAAKQSRLD